MKRAFLFAGQGQQFLNMGQDLAQFDKRVQDLYDRAHEITGIDVLNLDEAQLNQTRYTQIAMYVLEVAIMQLLDDVKVDAVCGLSLGEYAALTKAGVIDFEAGVKLIQKRASIMDDAFEPGSTGMVAVLKTSIDVIEPLLENTGIEICNYNTVNQIVIGGYQEDLDKLLPKLKEAGIRMVIRLNVSSVSHMSLLNEASEVYRKELDTIEFGVPKIPFIANVSADFQDDDFQESLQKQICKRTLMYPSIQRLVDAGITEFIEIGPKGSLSKFVKAIHKDLSTFNIYDVETLNAFQERV